MKRAILYLLLLSYATVILKPIMPTLGDVMAHVFWYSRHMATVHYEHGKYHVHYDYLAAAKKDAGDKNTALPKTTNSTSDHLVIRQVYNFYVFQPPLSHLQHWLLYFPTTAHSCDYPPPKYRI